MMKNTIYFLVFGGCFMELFREHLSQGEIAALPTLTLAHAGDAVYELLARGEAIHAGACKVAEAHRRTVALVSAPAQAKAAQDILPLLSEQEKGLFLRGRNTRVRSIPQHATMRDYSYATGLETLLGALYLTGQTARVAELWERMKEALYAEE